MRKLIRLAVIVLLVTGSVGLYAQQLPSKSLEKVDVSSFSNSKHRFEHLLDDEHYYLLVHFDQLPENISSGSTLSKGIKVLSYRSDNTYLAAIPKRLKSTDLQAVGINEIQPLHINQKRSANLDHLDEFKYAINGEFINLAIQFVTTTNHEKINQIIDQYGANVLEDQYLGGKLIVASVPQKNIDQLLNEPIVEFVDVQQEAPQPLNNEVRSNQRTNYLNAQATGLPGLNGNGVTIGVGDGGQLGDHLDFDCRVINMTDGSYSSFGAHGDHVSGIMTGAGWIDPLHRGMACEADLVVQKTSLITYNSEDYYNDLGMVLTNNSYGTSYSCNRNGTYNYTSKTLDYQLRTLPKMLHIYAAGNAGSQTCGNYPKGYKSILRYYQAAKNVLTVGSVDENRVAWSSSSRGPVSDGRLKPEICGIGVNVLSTGRDFNYWRASGTSMAAPAVTGTLALLIERYKQLNPGTEPDGALLKALACNTADDLGNKGPDYIYGYGLINGRRALKTMEAGQYIQADISNNETQQHNITVPANTDQLKVMLYWHDKDAEISAHKALVNDLDLEVLNQSGQAILPWVLNPDTLRVGDPAVRQIDTLNNIEQVTIDQPAAGNYTIKIGGSLVPEGPQSYYIVYEFVKDEVSVTFPVGGEQLIPGSTELIQWDAGDNSTETFKIEYSINGGSSWTTVADGLDADVRHYRWIVPADITLDAKVKVSQNGTSNSATSVAPFAVQPLPGSLSTEAFCDAEVALSWDGVSYATAYEVMRFDGCEFISIDTVTTTSYTINSGLNVNQKYWFAICAVDANGNRSRRTIAKSIFTSQSSLCDGDMAPRMYVVETDTIGRSFTSSALSRYARLFGKVRNAGQDSLTRFVVGYRVNEGSPMLDTIEQVLAPGDSLDFEFSNEYDLSNIGDHEINAWVEVEENGERIIDSLDRPVIARQLENDNISFPFSQTFDGVIDTMFTNSQLGLIGLTNWDYVSGSNGRLQVKDGILSFGPDNVNLPVNDRSEVLLTLNLGSIVNESRHLYLNFDYRAGAHNVTPLSGTNTQADTLWARGSDQESWVSLMALDTDTDWSNQRNLDISQALSDAGQGFSSSTQLMWSHSSPQGFMLDGINFDLAAPLPVEWLGVEAEVIASGVKISWKTASELNNDFYEIQVGYVTVDNRLSGEGFETIGRVEGGGNSAAVQIYDFIDTDLNKPGYRYYRIKQVDFDGTSEYSSIMVVEIERDIEQYTVYPNPFERELFVSYEGSAEDDLTISLYDTKGKLIYSYNTKLKNGRKNEVQGVENLPGGMYMLRVESASGTQNIPVVRQY